MCGPEMLRKLIDKQKEEILKLRKEVEFLKQAAKKRGQRENELVQL